MEVLLSGEDKKRTEHTRCTNSGVNALYSDNDAEVSDDPLDEQLPLILILSMKTQFTYTHRTHHFNGHSPRKH